MSKVDDGGLCAICGSHYSFAWTDTHGVAQCWTCGTPYTIYHYSDDNKRLDKPPELAVKAEYIPSLRTYWNETHSKIPGGHSFPGGQELASQAEIDRFFSWMKDNGPRNQTDD